MVARGKSGVAAAAAVLLALGVAGCQGHGDVSGRVFYRSQPR